jgi:hypothetical protein
VMPADNIDMSPHGQPTQSAVNGDLPPISAAPSASVDPLKPDSSTPAKATQYKTAPPPSATLDYEIRYATKGVLTHGSGSISWQHQGSTYMVNGKVSKFGLPLSIFSSEGSIDLNGLAPTLYREKNVRKLETTTHFSRDARQSISFSASTANYPLEAGAQDRASVLWQITSIARGDLEAFAPGNVLTITVAGVRDAEQWRIRILGQENIALENESVLAWHLVRSAQMGTSDRQIDIWVAPAMNWYPVKLRYTGASGDYLDFSMSTLHIDQAP